MAEFNIQCEAVDVERIMEQIRARVREKRGVDYTEEEIRELADVKLDRFLDPRRVRSDLLDHFRKRSRPAEAPAPIPPAVLETVSAPRRFDPDDVYRSSRGGVGRVLHAVRRMLKPVLKLFINPGPMLESLRTVSGHADATNKALETMNHSLNDALNTLNRALALHEERNRRRAELDVLMYEVLNNLVVEMTRLAIDVKNHRMRVESVAARLDFDERRARALEQIVQFRTPSAGGGSAAANEGSAGAPDGGGEDGAPEKRRRRRRRGRRRSGGAAAADAAPADAPAGEPANATQAAGADGGPAADAAGEPADAPRSPGADGGPAADAGSPADAAPAPAGDASEP